MNNVDMNGLNAMGGQVNMGGPVGGVRPGLNDTQRSQLNTYIYDYFLRNEMYDCARALIQHDPQLKVIKGSPSGRDANGLDDGDDGDSKDEFDAKRPKDLPRSEVPQDCPESCFLYEWWCLFWDMFNAQRGKTDGPAGRYMNYTQTARAKQEQQQNMLRGIQQRDGMMSANFQQMARMGQVGGMGPNELRKAIANRNPTPQQQQMMAQKQNAMQRDPSNSDPQQRPGSPGSAENAPSPSKRPRLDGGNGFAQQPMPNGRGQPQGMPQQFQNNPRGALAGYQAGLAQQQKGQMPGSMPNNGAGPATQGSPMINQGQDGGAIAGYYSMGEMGPNAARAGAPGQPPNATGGGNHALQDYQMQLMLLEQQNKKRLMMARQEQDSMTTVPGREGVMGPNGQPFQGNSPQGARSVNSPNPTEQMKRGMNAAGMPSPLPEGSRGSPGAMNFNMPGGQMDPNMNPQFFMKNGGNDPNMVNAMGNGMRPPSSHPGNGFGGQNMIPNQLAQQRGQMVNASGFVMNGQMMPGAGPQGQNMGQGTPQQRPMGPPAAPGAGGQNRTQPSSPQQGAAPPTPQQGNKANPSSKKKSEVKDNKAAKRKKPSVPNAGATPSVDSAQEPATPTPATPNTPVHPNTFKGQNGAAQATTNGQPAPMNTGMNAAPQQDMAMNSFLPDNTNYEFGVNMEFATPMNGGTDVLQDFDFDSFLHQDDPNDNFGFDATGFLDNGNELIAD